MANMKDQAVKRIDKEEVRGNKSKDQRYDHSVPGINNYVITQVDEETAARLREVKRKLRAMA